MTRILLAFVFLSALPAWGQTRVESLGWMTGSWEQAGTERVMETWTPPSDGMMVGASLTTTPGRRSFEFMRIVDTADGMSYLASPSGRSPPVEFKLRESGDKRVVFENPGHDFPQRIIYWKDGDLLAARIEGSRGGIAKSEEWKYQPVRNAPSGGSGG